MSRNWNIKEFPTLVTFDISFEHFSYFSPTSRRVLCHLNTMVSLFSLPPALVEEVTGLCDDVLGNKERMTAVIVNRDQTAHRFCGYGDRAWTRFATAGSKTYLAQGN